MESRGNNHKLRIGRKKIMTDNYLSLWYKLVMTVCHGNKCFKSVNDF